MSANTRDAIAAELQRIEEDCNHSGKAHFNAGERWSLYHYLLGLPSVALSAFVGTALLKNQPEIAAALSTVVTILAALMTFLKPSERAPSHKALGDQYLALRNDARVFREVKLDHCCDEQSAITNLDEFTKRRNELNAASAPFSNGDYKKARDGINRGEATHMVDKARS